ncbi:hypothetical protein RHSIM_Rhsim08G0124400 [Rhododendron simsii]|uniref:Nucleoporin protein Ndc1-Nup n=1 Tax=Rhododendron simsii TaxID=118357 RepID=A0A834GMV0_RHOSS|nr:hypothetical protein RHSIM_Rhsim08G0124400 [Rhododendron simsii]
MPGGFGNGGDAEEEVVKNRFLGFLLWQSVQSTVLYFLCKSLLLSPFAPNPFTPSIPGCFAFITFHLSLLLFSASLFAVASPQPHTPASPLELALGLVRAVFVSGGPPPPPEFRRRARISLTFVLFVASSALSGFLSLISLCWNNFGDSVGQKYYWRLLGTLGFRGLAFGFFYGLCYLYKKRWVLQFPIIQRPPFFSFKMGLPSASLQALKLSTAAYFFSAVLSLLLPYKFKGQVTMGKVLVEHIIFYMAVFVIFLCWELNHHLHQVLHTKRFIFAPAKGSAAAETNPSEPLLAGLEESIPRSLMQYLAYLDLCMVCESNVDAWRRAAFFEETGETYKRVITICLRPLEQFASKLGEGLESSSSGKSFQLDHQLRLPTDSRLSSRLHELFDDFQLCVWCARIVASLTIHSHKEDRFGVAQLSGSNSAVISTLLSCLLAVETFMGKKNSLQSSLGSAGIKWATASTGRREAAVIGLAAGKRRGSPLHSKAYCMADVLRTSIYYIVSGFHDEMLTSAKAGLLDKEWITSCKPVYGSRELLLHKLRLFLDFQAN